VPRCATPRAHTPGAHKQQPPNSTTFLSPLPTAHSARRPTRTTRPRAHTRGPDPPLGPDGSRQGHRRPPASHRGEASLDGGRRKAQTPLRPATRIENAPLPERTEASPPMPPVRLTGLRPPRAPAARARRDALSATATPRRNTTQDGEGHTRQTHLDAFHAGAAKHPRRRFPIRTAIGRSRPETRPLCKGAAVSRPRFCSLSRIAGEGWGEGVNQSRAQRATTTNRYTPTPTNPVAASTAGHAAGLIE
jgi:hypothetical protein